jgi:hypothetical protein
MNPKHLLILNQLNEANLLYGLGGSMMLKLRSFEINPHDIDLFVSIDDYHKVIDIFSNHAIQVDTHSQHPFKTKHFTSFRCEDTTFDIMAGFAYEHLEGIYVALFDKLSISDYVQIDKTDIPLMSLEEWFILYSVMNRRDKVELIVNAWKQQNIEHPYLLERQLSLELPYSVKQRILKLTQTKEASLNQ